MKRAKDKLKDLQVRPSKERGQNFIIKPGVIGQIVEFGQATGAAPLLEIGPGLGDLTNELSRFPNLSLLEIEPAFCADLQLRFPNAQIFQGDARTFDYAQLAQGTVVFGNLPYAFSTDILFRLLDFAPHLSRAVLMLQREFAERVAAPPGGRDYGVLSVNAQMWADMRLGPIISGDSFHPPTKVQSRLLELKFLQQPRVEIPDLAWFKKVVKSSFLQRRRKLLNSLGGANLVSKENLLVALTHCQIDPGRRAETLSVEEFRSLSIELARYTAHN